MNKKTVILFLFLCGVISLCTACQTAGQGAVSSAPVVSSGISQAVTEKISGGSLSLLPSPGPGETTPELFLAARTEEELLQFIDAAYSAVGGSGKKGGFASPAEIDSEGLLSFFFRTTDDRAFYREETGDDGEEKRYYLIPLEAVTEQLDRYFDGYHFHIEDTAWAEDLDADKKQFISRSFVGWGDSVVWKMDTAAAEGDHIFITANQVDPEDPERVLTTGTVRLSLQENGIRFLSFQYQFP